MRWVAQPRIPGHAEDVPGRSDPPPGLQLPRNYKWSRWWDTRRGCAQLLCAFGSSAATLWAVAVIATGWVETASGLLAGLATFMALGALLGVLRPTERGRWHWG